MGEFKDRFSSYYKVIKEYAKYSTMVPGTAYNYSAALDSLNSMAYGMKWRELAEYASSKENMGLIESIVNAQEELRKLADTENGDSFVKVAEILEGVFGASAELKDYLTEKGIDDGGFFEAVDLLEEGVQKARYTPFGDSEVTLDDIKPEDIRYEVPKGNSDETDDSVYTNEEAFNYTSEVASLMDELKRLDEKNPYVADPNIAQLRAALEKTHKSLSERTDVRLNSYDTHSRDAMAGHLSELSNIAAKAEAACDPAYKSITYKASLLSEMALHGVKNPHEEARRSLADYQTGKPEAVAAAQKRYFDGVVRASDVKTEDIIAGFTPEQKERYDLILSNNEIIKNQFPDKAMSESEMLARTLNPKYLPLTELGNTIDDINIRGREAKRKALSELGMTLDPGIDRLVQYDMDLSGTEEANRKNVLLLKQLNDPVKRAEYIDNMIGEMAQKQLGDYCFSSYDDVIATAKEDPKVLLKAFAAKDILKTTAPIAKSSRDFLSKSMDVLQNGGLYLTHISGLSSAYYGTLPDDRLTIEELFTIQSDLARESGKRFKEEIQKGRPKPYESYQEILNYERNEALSEENRTLAARAETEQGKLPLYKLVFDKEEDVKNFEENTLKKNSVRDNATRDAEVFEKYSSGYEVYSEEEEEGYEEREQAKPEADERAEEEAPEEREQAEPEADEKAKEEAPVREEIRVPAAKEEDPAVFQTFEKNSEVEHVGSGLQNKYSELREVLDGVDSAFTRSSYEFAEVKRELAAIEQGDTPSLETSRESLEKVYRLAGDYVSKKKKLQLQEKDVNEDRLNAMQEVLITTSNLLNEHDRAKKEVLPGLGDKAVTERDLNTIEKLNPNLKVPRSSLSAEERLKREAIRKRFLEKKELEIPVEAWNDPQPASSQRFDVEFLMTLKRKKDDFDPTPEEIAENERINRVFRNPSDYPEDAKKYAEMMFKKIADAPMESLISEGLDAEKFVDNFDEYKRYSTLFASLENVDQFCRLNGIEVDKEIREKAFDQEKYFNYAGTMKYFDDMISNPYFTMFDTKDLLGTVFDERVNPGFAIEDYAEYIGRDGLNLASYSTNSGFINKVQYQTIIDFAMQDMGISGNEYERVGVISPDGEIDKVPLETLRENDECYLYDKDNPSNRIRIPEGGLTAFLKQRREYDYAREIKAEDRQFQNREQFLAETGKNYRKTCGKLVERMTGADSIFTRSSKEYAGILKELKTVMKCGNLKPEEVLKSTDKLSKLAKQYIENKKGKTLTDFEKKRLNAVKKVAKEAKAIHADAALGVGLMKAYPEVNERKLKREKRLEESRLRDQLWEEKKTAERNKAEDLNKINTMPEFIRKMSAVMAAPNDLFAGEGVNTTRRKLDFVEHVVHDGIENLSDYEKGRIDIAMAQLNDKPESERVKYMCEGMSKLMQSIDKVQASQPELNDTVKDCGRITENLSQYVTQNKGLFDRNYPIDNKAIKSAEGTRMTAEIAEKCTEARKAILDGMEPSAEREEMLAYYLAGRTVENALKGNLQNHRSDIADGIVTPSFIQSLTQIAGDTKEMSDSLMNQIRNSDVFKQLNGMSKDELSHALLMKSPDIGFKTVEIVGNVIKDVKSKAAPAKDEPEPRKIKNLEEAKICKSF